MTPGMEDTEEADFCPEMLGVGSDRSKGLGRGAEQDVVNDYLIVIGDGGDLLGDGEDNVEVFGIEEFRLTVFQPLGARE